MALRGKAEGRIERKGTIDGATRAGSILRNIVVVDRAVLFHVVDAIAIEEKVRLYAFGPSAEVDLE